MKILYLIPARKGSKGIPGKNKKLFCGKPLILYTLELARMLCEDKDICISTNDEEIIALLKDNGYLAVTEVVYLRSDLPDPLLKYWENEYPDIKDIQGKIREIQEEKFSLITNFTLPKSAWLENYYFPMEN